MGREPTYQLGQLFQRALLERLREPNERRVAGPEGAVLKVLASRGIEKGSEAFQTMESLLEEKPSDAFMRESLSVLRDVTGGLGDRASTIVDLCIKVAASSGGFLGLKIGQKIGDDEKQQIESILASLGPDAAKAVQDDLAK